MVDLINPHGDVLLMRDDRLSLTGLRKSPGALILTELSENGNVRCEFPINPPEITIRRGRNTTTVPIINLGDVLLPGSLTLNEISFEAILPRYYDPTLCNVTPVEEPDAFHPEGVAGRLEYWMGRREDGPQANPTVLQVTVADRGYSRRMIITSLDDTERGGEPDALYLKVTLREWRDQRIEVTRGEPRAQLEAARRPGTGVGRTSGFPTASPRTSALAFVSIFGVDAARAQVQVLEAEARAERLRERSAANPDDYALALQAQIATEAAQELRAAFDEAVEQQSAILSISELRYQSYAGGGYVPTAPRAQTTTGPGSVGAVGTLPASIMGPRPSGAGTLHPGLKPPRPFRTGAISSYVTKEGDTLEQVAITAYGQGQGGLWDTILAANYRVLVPRSLAGATPNVPPARWTALPGGRRLTIPPRN